MRVPLALWIVGLSLLNSGCTLFTDAAGLLAYKTRESVNDYLEWQRNEEWAEDAWDEVCDSDPDHVHSEDYARGFKDGFATYLYEGGTGEPPLVPPKRYRALRYQTAQGYLAVQDWFAGFRHGAAMARQSGYRQFVTGPSSLPHAEGGHAPALVHLGEPRPAPGATAALEAGPTERLPPPRKVEPGPEGGTGEPPLPLPKSEPVPPGKATELPLTLPQVEPVPPGKATELPLTLPKFQPTLESKQLEPLPPVILGPACSDGDARVPTTAGLAQASPAPRSAEATGPRQITIHPLLPGLSSYEIHLSAPSWWANHD